MPATARIYRIQRKIKLLPQPIAISGLKILGDSRKFATLESGEKQYFVVVVNDEELQVVKLRNEGKQ